MRTTLARAAGAPENAFLLGCCVVVALVALVAGTLSCEKEKAPSAPVAEINAKHWVHSMIGPLETGSRVRYGQVAVGNTVTPVFDLTDGNQKSIDIPLSEGSHLLRLDLFDERADRMLYSGRKMLKIEKDDDIKTKLKVGVVNHEITTGIDMDIDGNSVDVSAVGTMSTHFWEEAFTYQWHWGDGSASGSGKSSTHSYNSGSFELRLHANDPHGAAVAVETVEFGACCTMDGRCRVLTEQACGQLANSRWFQDVQCEPDLCLYGACCDLSIGNPTSTCTVMYERDCLAEGDVFVGHGEPCSPSPCTNFSCCFPDGACEVLPGYECDQNGGTRGFEDTCGPYLCPVQWPENGHWYSRVHRSIYWDEAKAEAEGMMWEGVPGHLATITSEDENFFIWNTVIGGLGLWWLGGYQYDRQEPPNEAWRWVTDEEWDYENWHPGEPNDLDPGGGDEYLLEIYSGRWNDLGGPQTHSRYFIVEFPVGKHR